MPQQAMVGRDSPLPIIRVIHDSDEIRIFVLALQLQDLYTHVLVDFPLV
jgi:hypothetical protein